MQLNFSKVEFETSLNAYELYLAVEKGTDYILLDSSEGDSPLSKHSIIGVNPFMTVKYENGIIYIKDYKCNDYPKDFIKISQTDIFAYLENILKTYKVDDTEDLPFVGGGIGYFAYDLARDLEVLPSNTIPVVQIPDCYFVFYDNGVIINHQTKIVTVTGLGILDESEKSISSIKTTIDEFSNNLYEKVNRSSSIPINISEPPVFKSFYNRAGYQNAVNTMRDYIKDGHIYIANMTHTFAAEYHGDPLKTYEGLRHINPAPFSAYMPLDGFHVLSSSPERFLEIRNQEVQTRPIKGTIPRGKTEAEDNRNRNILINSEKDKSELLMIVDLERNDLSKVCMPGSIRVSELFMIEEYSTVFHLVSTINGRLKNSNSIIDCIKATFPGGSITGAPKIRAMEIIDELERTKRGIYTGSIGYLSFNGQADLNIVIRTILLKDQKAFIGVGGGITWESDADSEYQETLDKAKALFLSLSAEYKEDEVTIDGFIKCRSV